MDPFALLVLIIGTGSSIMILLAVDFFERAPQGSNASRATVLFPRAISARNAVKEETGPVRKVYSVGEGGIPDGKTIHYSRLKREFRPRRFQELDSGMQALILEKAVAFRDLQASVLLNNLLRTPYSSTRDIGEIIAANPLLAGKILRTVNSSYFGLSTEIQSVDRAAAMLGNDTLRPLVLQEGIHATISRQIPLRNIDEFNSHWLHATAVAACARYLGERVFFWNKEDLYTIGLFHDVGKYLLPMLGGGTLRATAGMPSVMHEEEQFGASHTLLGSIVAGEWRMPATVVGCIEYHHHPLFTEPDGIPERYRTPCFIICAADLICKILGYGGIEPGVFPIRERYFKDHGLTPDLRALITEDLISEVERACLRVRSLITLG